MKSYFAVPQTGPAPRTSPTDGRLYLLVRVPEPIQQIAVAYQGALLSGRDHVVSKQPRDLLHVPVHPLPASEADLSDDQHTRFYTRLQQGLRDDVVGPITLGLGAVKIGVRDVSLELEDLSGRALWARLTVAINASVLDTFGGLSDELLDGSWAPRIVLGYGMADADSDPLLAALDARPSSRSSRPVPFTVEAVDLVAIRPDPRTGTVGWNSLNRFPLPVGPQHDRPSWSSGLLDHGTPTPDAADYAQARAFLIAQSGPAAEVSDEEHRAIVDLIGRRDEIRRTLARN